MRTHVWLTAVCKRLVRLQNLRETRSSTGHVALTGIGGMSQAVNGLDPKDGTASSSKKSLDEARRSFGTFQVGEESQSDMARMLYDQWRDPTVFLSSRGAWPGKADRDSAESSELDELGRVLHESGSLNRDGSFLAHGLSPVQNLEGNSTDFNGARYCLTPSRKLTPGFI